MKKSGISLILLIITIVIIIILASTVILSLSNNGILDQSKKAKFMSDFTSVKEGVTIYSSSKYNPVTGKFELPLTGYLTTEDKTYIKENVPTLNIKIDSLSGAIDSANLAWISSENIGVKLSSEKQEKGYILDVNTGQIYDYNGDFFEGKRWHTLDSGVDLNSVSDGYIKLTLLYPAGSIERQWRLGNPGELRLDASLQWQDYVSPINIPIYRIQDVWIKYILNGNYVTVPPAGVLLVDIIPDETVAKVEQVTVTINYDEDAVTKEYRIGNSGWMPYTVPFVITENTIVAARSTKVEETKDSSGNVILVRDIFGSDKIFIGNIGVEESDLVAPTIERLEPLDGSEKARVKITYPEGTNQNIYKINYGLENNYTGEISIKEWDTSILAYYYDAIGRRSRGVMILINDPTIEPKKLPIVYKSIDKNDLNDLSNPYNPSNSDSPYNPTNPYSTLNPSNPYSPYNPTGEYNPDSPNYINFTDITYDPTNLNNQPVSSSEKLVINITANPEPLPNTTKVSTVVVSIDYDVLSTSKTYKINNGPIQSYTGSFQITENSTIYAYATGNAGKAGTATKLIDNLLLGISQPLITPNPSESIMSGIIKIGIQYDKNATVKKYSVDGGELKDYDGEFEVMMNGSVVYAYNENIGGESAESTYTVTNIDPNLLTQVEESPVERTSVLDKSKYYIMKLSYPENSSVKDYKFTQSGTWTPYKQDGIMLIKSEYKDEVLANIQSNGVLRIQDEFGDTIDFNGDWYVVNTSISTLIESLFMRWDLSELSGPQIISNTMIPVKQVTITMICPEGYKSRQYKVAKLGDVVPDTWLNYTGPFIIDTNNSTIYAKYTNEYDEESGETTYKVTNIDEISPVIDLNADFITNQQQILVQVEVTDNMEVDIVKWDAGTLGESYFENSGTEILNNSTITITENGTYTFYAVDTVGNKQTYTLTVTNISKEPPTVRFTPDGQTNIQTASTKVDVTTASGAIDNSSLQYVWDTSNTTEPNSGWASFVNGETITKGSVDGTYYLWIKASNTIGGEIITKSNAFTMDNTLPTVIYGTNGTTDVIPATTTVTVNDLGGSELNLSTLQYVWDTQNSITPASGWATFTNGGTLTKTSNGTYYLWIKASDNAGNVLVSKTNAFTMVMITVYNFSATGGAQTFVIPYTGTYKLELWGASGGNGQYSGISKGGYAYGNIALTKGDVLNIYVGRSYNGITGGYNGGGNGYNTYNYSYGAAGGGGTDIRIGGTSINNRIIVAGGGGGGTQYNVGGAGGNSSAGSLFQGGTPTNAAGGGGGGYRGGVAGNYGTAGGGGSSYIGGVQNGSTVAGVNADHGRVTINYLVQ